MSLTISAGNPIVVTGTTSTAQVITDDIIFIRYVYWFNPTSLGDLVNLINRNGDVVIPIRCETSTYSQWFTLEVVADGLYCDDMDSGTLLIYTR